MQARPIPLKPCSIEDYAIIGDCRTAALVSRTGSIDWLCLPDFSSPALFAGLLDPERGGSCAIRPTGHFTANRHYVDGTAVLETTFTTDDGAARVIDLAPIDDGTSTLRPLREVLRVVEATSGIIELEVTVDPRPDYARRSVSPRRRGALGWIYAWSNEIVALHTDVSLRPDGRLLRGVVRLAAGERRCLSIAYAKGDPVVFPGLGREANRRVDDTVAWWRAWSARCRYGGPYREQVVRSLITLKLMHYCLSGAIVAAPTTSLPEVIGGGHNWDYRYCWLRDAGLTCEALIALGYLDEASSFLRWMLHATRLTWPELRVMYDVVGRTQLAERELPHLAGYRGSGPVRIGNGAYRQLQLDVYGEVVVAAEAVASNGGRLGPAETRMLTGFGRSVCRQWRQPDSGIWETRGPLRHFTLSKAMCWAALDRLLKLHEAGAIALAERDIDRFRRERLAITASIETRGFNSALGSYVSELDGDRLDASLLLLACIGYCDAGEPRMRGTFDLIQRRLATDGLLYRSEPRSNPRDVEGAFGIASFWAIDNLAKRGDVDDAECKLRHLIGFANDLGLYAEEIDVTTGAALGNFPQAFTHVGLINAAVAVEAARK